MTIRLALAAVLALALAAHAAGADSPTKDEWDPVQAAIAAGAPDAEAQVAALTTRFPQWSSGHREHAKLQLRRRDHAAALASAEKALALDGSEAEAARVQIQSLGALRRFDEAWKALDAFTGKDKGGWVRYDAAKVAIDAADLPRAERLLKDAREKAVNSTPSEFFFLQSRLELAKGDPEAARLSLEQAVKADSKLYEGWYELGRVELALAAMHPDRAKVLIDDAVTHFERALAGRAEDANVLYGLGYARYERAKQVLRTDEDAGGAQLRDAVAVLDQAIAKQPDFGLARYVLGNVLVQLGRWADAIPHLQRAHALGVQDRSSWFNLALALEKNGDSAGAAEILARTKAETPGEQIVVAMNAYRARDFRLAAKLLETVAPQLADDPQRQAAALRFLGHALRQVGEKTPAAADGADGAGSERTQLLDQAAAAYAAAAALKDRVGREHYLALQTSRGAELGFAAGLRFLGWTTWMSPRGYGAVIGNYGGWLTGGRGFAGAWARHPGHVGTWGGLAGLCLIMFVVGFFRRGGRPTREDHDAEPRRSARLATPAERPSARTPDHKRTPPERRPAPAQKRETEVVTPTRPRGGQASAQKSETEEMPPQAGKATGGWTKELGDMKPSNEAGSGQALERKRRT